MPRQLPDHMQTALDKAMEELETMYSAAASASRDVSGDEVGAWYMKWYHTATYKHLSRAWIAFLRRRGVNERH